MQDTIKLIYDKKSRQKLISNPQQYVLQLGLNIATDVEIIVKTNTKNKYYIAMPYQKGTVVDIASIQAAGSASTAGTVGTGSCLVSCVLSVSTVACAGSAS